MTTEREREALRLVRVSNRKLNEIRTGANESYHHQLAKKSLCQYFLAVGKNFITEAIFEKGGRADIFLLDDLTVVELLCTESLENIEVKKKTYPTGLKFIAIQVT